MSNLPFAAAEGKVIGLSLGPVVEHIEANEALSGNDNQDRSRPGGADSDGDLNARLKRLEARLEETRPTVADAPEPRSGQSAGPSPLGQAMRLSTEFVAGVIAGGVLGWIFDRMLGTSPWGLMVFVLLGFVTGIYNVMRMTGFGGKTGGGDQKK